MKNLMREVGPDNAGAYVQLVEESIEALEKNDGNMEKAYTWYTTKCRAEWKKAEKKSPWAKFKELSDNIYFSEIPKILNYDLKHIS